MEIQKQMSYIAAYYSLDAVAPYSFFFYSKCIAQYLYIIYFYIIITLIFFASTYNTFCSL